MTTVLCILDGWGHREETHGNAIHAARTPNWDRFLSHYPHATLETSGEYVGLPDGQMGNSEVGHMNLGAGRVVMQDLPRIDAAFQGEDVENIPSLKRFIESLKKTGGVAHLMGLLSPGGVHSHQNHIIGMANIISAQGIEVKIHGFLDGRDVPPKSAKPYLEEFISALPETAELVSIAGRFYAMDRDKRWDRVQAAYQTMVNAYGEVVIDFFPAIDLSYEEGITDEFVVPKFVNGYQGMQDGDGLMMCNFRADRARQILSAFVDEDFEGFKRSKKVNFSAVLGMVEYSQDLANKMDVLFPPLSIEMTLGEVISQQNKKQLRIAETEKYAHVTFFFNGGAEIEFTGEERILVPSPNVKTYDLKPEMSASELTEKLVEAISSKKFDLIVVNYANGDMVGHTGDFDAAIKAVETLDGCLGRLEEAVLGVDGEMLVTADHGNVEEMIAHDGGVQTSHSCGPVPIVSIGKNVAARKLLKGSLSDVAPTILEIMGIAQPKQMTGKSLLKVNM